MDTAKTSSTAGVKVGIIEHIDLCKLWREGALQYFAKDRMARVGQGLALLAVLFSPRTLSGYSCSGPNDCEVPQPNDVIFVGVVVRQGQVAKSINEPAHPTIFRVLDSFHGLDPGAREVEIWSPYYRNFLPGSRWIVDSIRSAVDGIDVLNDRHCGRSARLDDPDTMFREYAQAFLKRLTERRAGTAPTTVRIYPFASLLSGSRWVGQLDVVLRNAERTFQFSVPDDGLIFEGEIVPGRFDVAVAGGPFPFLGLRDGNFTAHAGSCNDLRLEFGYGSRISGIVTLPNGKPAGDARVSLTDVSRGTGEKQTLTTDDAGTYEFRGMAPGEYILWVQKPGYRDTYHPGAVSATTAQPIRIEADTVLADIAIRIIEEIPLSEVTLQVSGVDGNPMASTPIRVHIRELFEGNETINWGLGGTDFKGEYVVASKVGAHLEITATAGTAAELYSDSTVPLEKGSVSFTILEAVQTQSLRLTERLCKTKTPAYRWEPRAAQR